MPAPPTADAPAKRRLLFYRDFERYSGGHGKVWDYFNHARQAPGWQPAIHLTARSTDEQNPWRMHQVEADERWEPGSADALLLGGMDWRALPEDDPARPVINLVQHVRHGDPADPRHAFLNRRAVRVCVSAEVASAIISAGPPNGPVLVIEAGVDLPELRPHTERSGVFIDAIKQPALGRALAALLKAQGREVVLNGERIPREEYLRQMASAEVAVLLPRPTEGFYLPGVEAMALGCAAVVPDCIGNRAYLDPEHNALAPPLEADALAHAVAQLDEPRLRSRLVAAGQETARRFSLDREREAFHQVLADLDRLWQD